MAANIPYKYKHMSLRNKENYICRMKENFVQLETLQDETDIGVYINPCLTFDKHISYIANKCGPLY